MVLPIVYLLAGFVGLYFGADLLVRGSASLARSTGIRPVVIAITVVAFGTSAPELVVSVGAAIHKTSDIAIGNIVGSMIANMGLILGMAAVVKPIKIEFRLLKKEIPILIACELLFFGLIWNLKLSRIDGVILFAGFIAFNWYCVREALKNIKDEKERVEKEYSVYISRKGMGRVRNILFIVVGISALLLGSHFVIKAAVKIADILGIAPFIIAASIVAFGTSLPELATSVIAAAKGEADISVGNVLGSNIFNLLMCLGLASIVMPLSAEMHVVRYDIPIMIGISIILGFLMWTRLRIGRLEGVLLLLIYGGYLVYLFG